MLLVSAGKATTSRLQSTHFIFSKCFSTYANARTVEQDQPMSDGVAVLSAHVLPGGELQPSGVSVHPCNKVGESISVGAGAGGGAGTVAASPPAQRSASDITP